MKRLIIFLFAIILTTTFVQAITAIDGDFENGAFSPGYGWGVTPAGFSLINTDSSGYGTWCLEYADTGVAFTNYAYNMYYFAEAGDKIQASIDIKALPGYSYGGDIIVQIRFINEEYNAVLGSVTENVPGAYVTSNWTTYTTTIGNAPAGTAYLDFHLFPGWNGSSSGTVRFDNLVLTNAGTALNPSHITATPTQDVPNRNGDISGDWAFSLWALYAVNGAGLNGNGEHQTGDTGAMYMNDTGLITTFHPAGLNNTYKAYVNAMFDDEYFLTSLRIWNFNGAGNDRLRGFNNVDIHASYDYGKSYSLVGSYTFDVAPGTSDYTGFLLDIPNRYYTDIVISAVDNHGDASWIGLAEVQFIQGDPQPGPAKIFIPYNGGFAYDVGELSWLEGNMGPFESYDVYLATSYDEVYNAENIPCSSLIGDLDGNCDVNEVDMELLADCWLLPSSCNPDADLYASGDIEFHDFAVFANNWLDFAYPSYKGNQSSESFSYNDLTVGQTYYWRIDEYVSGSQYPIVGDVWSFTVEAKKFFNMLGWAELNQMTTSWRDDYAQDVADMGIRQAMDRNNTIPYYYPEGVEVAMYHDVMSKSGFNPFPDKMYDIIAGYENDPGNWGYYMFDEPKDGTSNSNVRKEMYQVDQIHDTAYDADPSRPSLTTLYSSHGATDIYGYIDSYFNQVDQIPILCYDHYPYRYGITGSRGHWRNLEIFRARALTEGIPLYCWSETNQGGGTGGYVGDTTNRNRLRWSNYSRLAYGAKGICWWGITKAFTFSGDNYGQRTYTLGDAYDDVAEVNAEINRVGDEMVYLNSTAIYHKNRPESYCTEIPVGHWIQLNNADQILGMFEDAAGNDYAMVCNRNDSAGITSTVTFSTTVSSVQIFDEQTGNWSSLTINGSPGSQYVQFYMGPGYGKLLKID